MLNLSLTPEIVQWKVSEKPIILDEDLIVGIFYAQAWLVQWTHDIDTGASNPLARCAAAQRGFHEIR